MTDEDRQHLYENFETSALLEAIDVVDRRRDALYDGGKADPRIFGPTPSSYIVWPWPWSTKAPSAMRQSCSIWP